MSSAMLREALESLVAKPTPSTKAGLVAIAPKRARVWWDPDAIENLDDIIAGLTKPRPVLRFFDVTGLDPGAGRWNAVFDIDIDIGTKGRNVDFWTAGRSYVVELGLVHADGLFRGLARTNPIALPGEGGGGETAVSRTNLLPGSRKSHPETIPDQAAREWAETRPDHPGRDLEAELVIHMLYKAFLASGPRALRLSPRVFPRESVVLRQEFVQRRDRRERQSRTSRPPEAPLLLVADLGAAKTGRNEEIRYSPALRYAAPCRLYLPNPSRREFGFFSQLAAFSRMGRQPWPGTADLVRPMEDGADLPLPPMASSAFEAADRLRRRLPPIPRIPSLPGNRERMPAGPPSRSAGGGAGRFARAGVSFNRVTATLEGRTSPGARLKVAGKLVEADAEGRFRLECTLSGMKNSPPPHADFCPGGLKSRIRVDWGKVRRSREGGKA